MDFKENEFSELDKQEHMIPKHRFDEINELYKETKGKLIRSEDENREKEKQIETLCKQIEEIQSGYEKASKILRVKEIFVSGGLTENEYQDLINIISNTSEFDMCELASCITKLINEKNLLKDWL